MNDALDLREKDASSILKSGTMIDDDEAKYLVRLMDGVTEKNMEQILGEGQTQMTIKVDERATNLVVKIGELREACKSTKTAFEGVSKSRCQEKQGEKECS